MIFFIALFWLLVIWAFFDGDISLREAGIFILFWIALVGAIYLFKAPLYWAIPPAALLDIILIIKIFGGDIVIPRY
jgi:hypothetical protein